MTSNQQPGRDRNRLQAVAVIAVFDIAGPLSGLFAAALGWPEHGVRAGPEGIFPAFGVLAGLIRHRRLDAVGVLVLAGIAVGTVLGLLSGNPRLVLVEGSVPTAVFGLLCLGSLWSRRPLIFRFALEFMGAELRGGATSAPSGAMTGSADTFRLFTVVWGVTYLAEAAVRVIIVETTSTTTALTVSKFMPYVVGAGLVGWMVTFTVAGPSAGASNSQPPQPQPLTRPPQRPRPTQPGLARRRTVTNWWWPGCRPASIAR